ncbi:MAG: DNA topoisomerase IV [Capnocytophaga sp.]|nr:DNA topoisomerase IV [Capnocytophaga sp.]
MFTKVKNLSFTIVILFFYSCYQPQRNCHEYKTGKFVYEAEINGITEKSFFVRMDTLEIDYFQGKADSASIRWINDCEYILTKLHPKNNQEKKPIHMKIVTTDAQGYTFEFSAVGSPQNKMRGYAKRAD